jgi:hypothetical protein
LITQCKDYRVVSFHPDKRIWTASYRRDEPFEHFNAHVIGWLVVDAEAGTRHVVPAIVGRGGEVVPAAAICPHGWTMSLLGGHTP